ncbi:hypothetical protein GFK27_24395, partial [Salmonella enterica subsp. enterica serovar Enteritidis]|nr:hypothetical protein [Salmonella enterica subsp. enterica serovar Enteritidis]
AMGCEVTAFSSNPSKEQEVLAIKINEITGCQLHAGTVRRWLPSAGLVWRRAAPTLRIRDPHKDEKLSIRYFQKGSGHITF